MKILFFDTETTGLPKDYKAPITDTDNWPRLVELAFILTENDSELLRFEGIVKPDGFEIPQGATDTHGITTERALKEGYPISEILDLFNDAVEQADLLVGHNISFDRKIMGAENMRDDRIDHMHGKPRICTMWTSTNYCELPGKFNRYKWPQLQELHVKLFGDEFDGVHGALADIEATKRCYEELVALDVITEEKLNFELYKVWDDEKKRYYLPE